MSNEYILKDVNKIAYNINKEIAQYVQKYNDEPKIIIISKELELLLVSQFELMHQYILLNYKQTNIHYLFGIPCIVSKVLNNLEFEVR